MNYRPFTRSQYYAIGAMVREGHVPIRFKALDKALSQREMVDSTSGMPYLNCAAYLRFALVADRIHQTCKGNQYAIDRDRALALHAEIAHSEALRDDDRITRLDEIYRSFSSHVD